MSHRLFLCTVVFAALVGCSSDRDSIPLVQGSNGVASISGVAVVGDTLSASVSDPDGVQPGTESYQWYSNGEQISGATSSSYTLTSNEGGEAVTVVVRYTDSAGLRETIESAPVDIQAAFALGALYFHGLDSIVSRYFRGRSHRRRRRPTGVRNNQQWFSQFRGSGSC